MNGLIVQIGGHLLSGGLVAGALIILFGFGFVVGIAAEQWIDRRGRRLAQRQALTVHASPANASDGESAHASVRSRRLHFTPSGDEK